MDKAWLQKRIDKTKNLIEQYEDAQLQLSSGAIQSYTIDTGQTNQTVTKMNLSTIQRTIDSLYNRLAWLEQRRNGERTFNARPDW